MTTKIHSKNLFSSIFSVIHEGGHGLYHQGLPLETFGSPLSEHASMAIDESQSRFWEIFIGKNLSFWKHFFPKLQGFFPSLSNISLETFHAAMNQIRPSLIRIESDEVTYNVHIIIRFEIEKGLLEETIQVKDIPAIWNQKMEEYLGIVPQNESEGCLQDIHWSLGYIGYFPSYILGTCYAAQLFETFTKNCPHWQEEVEKGNLSCVQKWLHENIHQQGGLYTPHQLIEKVTGSPLNVDFFIRHIHQKYTLNTPL